jgi:hypothetical protein
MKLPLNDDVWTRLYGPYGNRSVNDIIAKLATRWDQDIVAELLWEELHHQDDIYPSTFAALPWLLEISPKNGESFEEVQLFLSHIIHCACSNNDGRQKGPYRGLSTNIDDHHQDWLPEGEWLRESDLPTLLTLEEWFSQNAAKIAEDCLSIISDDLTKAAYALEGFATFKGSTKVAHAVQMFADGEEQDIIEQDIGLFEEIDVRVVAALGPHLCQQNDEILTFLNSFAQRVGSPNSI